MTNEVTRIEPGGLPSWFYEAPAGVGAYDSGGGEAAGGDGLPWVGIATSKTGSGGGSTTLSTLQAAGVNEGDAYASGGHLQTPMRVSGTALLLMRTVRVAYRASAATKWRRENSHRITSMAQALPGEFQALDALVLVLDPAEPFLATYSERLNKKMKFVSTVLIPWADRIQKTTGPEGVPPWARITGRLRGEARTAKSSGSVYSKEILTLAVIDSTELDALLAWSRGPGGDVGEVLATWEAKYVDVKKMSA